jgi:thiosulfate reductase cytochrome b subunit
MDEESLVPRAEVSVSVPAGSLPGPLRDAFAPADDVPPVAAQRTSQTNAAKLQSEKVVIAAPLSYAGSAARIWRLTGVVANPFARMGLGVAALILIASAWVFVTTWYLFFGLFLVPYRLLRRGQRKRKRESLQHRELISAIQTRDGS